LNDLTKQILLWVALAVILLAIFSQFGMRTGQPATIDYSQFLSEVKSNNVDSVTLKGEIIEGKRRSSGETFVTYNPETNNTALIAQLNQTLMHGSLPSDASNIILAAANSIASTSTDPLAAARAASYLILTSAQYQVER